VDIPLDLDAGRFDGAARRLDDLGAGAVAWNEGDAMRQVPSPMRRASRASYARRGPIEQPVIARVTIEAVYSWAVELGQLEGFVEAQRRGGITRRPAGARRH